MMFWGKRRWPKLEHWRRLHYWGGMNALEYFTSIQGEVYRWYNLALVTGFGDSFLRALHLRQPKASEVLVGRTLISREVNITAKGTCSSVIDDRLSALCKHRCCDTVDFWDVPLIIG